MSKRRKKLEANIGEFIRQYTHKHKNTPDPNDRTYDRKVEEQIKRIRPEELNRLLYGQEEDDDG
jgi:hypothetical protein